MNNINYRQGIQALASAIVKQRENYIVKSINELSRVLNEYKELIRIDDTNINDNGVINFELYVIRKSKIQSILCAILSRRDQLLSDLEIYEYLVDTQIKMAGLNEYRDELIFNCIKKRLEDSSFKSICPYVNYSDYSSFDVSDLCELLKIDKLDTNIDLDLLREVLNYVSFRPSLARPPKVNTYSSLRDKGIFAPMSIEQLETYLNEKIIEELTGSSTLSDSVDSSILAKLKKSPRFDEYLRKTSYNLSTYLESEEDKEYSNNFMQFKYLYDKNRTNLQSILKNVDLVDFNIEKYVNNLTNLVIKKEDEIELPITKLKKPETKLNKFNFKTLSYLAELSAFDNETLNFIKSYTEEDDIIQIISHILYKRSKVGEDIELPAMKHNH